MLHKYDQVKQNVQKVSQYIGNSLAFIRNKPKGLNLKPSGGKIKIKSDKLVQLARSFIGKQQASIKRIIDKQSEKDKEKLKEIFLTEKRYIFTNDKIENNYYSLIIEETIQKYLPESYDPETDILLERNSDLYFQKSSFELQSVRFLLVYLSNSDLGVASMSTAHIFNSTLQYGMFQYVPNDAEGKNTLFQPLTPKTETERSKNRRTQLDSIAIDDFIKYVDDSVLPNRKIVDYYVAIYVEEVKNQSKGGTSSLVDQVISDLQNKDGIWKDKYAALDYAFGTNSQIKLLEFYAKRQGKMSFDQVVNAISSLLIKSMKENLTVEDNDVEFGLYLGKGDEYRREPAATMNFSENSNKKKLLLLKSVQNFVNGLFYSCKTQ